MSLNSFHRIVIVGLGAVGASLGLALKRSSYRTHRIGVDTDKILHKAKQIGAVDKAFTSWQEGIEGADFVLIDAPIPETERLLPEIARALPEGAILSDTMPVKLRISNTLRADSQRRSAYIGLHVLRKCDDTGIESAFPDFFHGVPMLLTPAQQNDMEAFGKVKNLMTTIGAQTFGMTPEVHDQLLAEIRQLPRLVTMAYLDFLFTKEAANRPIAQTFEPMLLNPIRDLSEQATEWHEEIAANCDSVIPALRSLSVCIESLADQLSMGNAETEIDSGKKRAARLLSHQGFQTPIPGVWVSLAATNASLSSVAEILARSNIIAKEVETSQRDGGCFVEILLESEEDADTAFKRLKGAGLLAGKL